MNKEGGKGAMRAAMPQVTSFVDALREAFGREHIDECVRRGLYAPDGYDWEFRASENGHHIGGGRRA